MIQNYKHKSEKDHLYRYKERHWNIHNKIEDDVKE